MFHSGARAAAAAESEISLVSDVYSYTQPVSKNAAARMACVRSWDENERGAIKY